MNWDTHTQEHMYSIITQGSQEERLDLFESLFKIRESNEYKNRYFFYDALIFLAKYSAVSSYMVACIPEHGCWKDMFVLWKRSPELRPSIDVKIRDQFQDDQESEVPSLLAKWLPREKSDKPLAIHFSSLLFPLTPAIDRLKLYRKTCAYMNRILDTTEIKMCSGNWSSIHPDRVPKSLFKRSKHLFLNKRRSLIEDRVRCSDNFNRRKNT